MADLSLVLIMAVWGSSFALQRALFVGGDEALASPLLLLGVRMATASALLALVLGLRGQLRGLTRQNVRDGLLCGSLLALGFLLQVEGQGRTSASRSGFLTGLLVVFTPMLEMAIFKKRPPLAAVLGVIVAFTGMTILSGPWRAAASSTLFGDGLTVCCALVFSGHILALGKVTARNPLWPLVLMQLACVAVAALAVGPLVEPQHLSAAPRLYFTIGYLALACTLLAFGVQTWAQRHTSPVRMALISALEPVFAALWAALLIGERLSLAELSGGALIIVGVVLGEAGPLLLRKPTAE